MRVVDRHLRLGACRTEVMAADLLDSLEQLLDLADDGLGRCLGGTTAEVFGV
jgi:hypothetical protein